MNHKFMKLAGIKDIDSFYKAFPTEDAFFKAFPNAAPKMPDGGKLQPKPKPAARQPIVVTSPNDPRLKAYSDSLNLYNQSNRIKRAYPNLPQIDKATYDNLTFKEDNLTQYEFDKESYLADKKAGRVAGFDKYIYSRKQGDYENPQYVKNNKKELSRYSDDGIEKYSKTMPDGTIKSPAYMYDGKPNWDDYEVYDPTTKTTKIYSKNPITGKTEMDLISSESIKPIETKYYGRDKLVSVGSINTTSSSTGWYGKGEKPVFKNNSNKNYQNYIIENESKDIYKKPVQPVVYQGNIPNGTNTPNSKGQQLVKDFRPQIKQTYKDSLVAYNNDINFDRELVDIAKKKGFATEEERVALTKKYPMNSVQPIKSYSLQEAPTLYTGKNGYKAKDMLIFKKPTGIPKPPERKDYPIRGPLPKAQAKINITSPQPYTDPIPQGDYIYGPANSVIGINSKNGFVPWDDNFDPTSNKSQRGTVNKADNDLLQNPTELKKYLKTKGLKNGGKLKAAWGAELGTNQFMGGPMPINPYPQGFKIPKLDAMGNPISDPVPNIGGATPWIAKGQPNPLAPVPSSITPVPYAPSYKAAQTQEWHGPQVEGSQEFENGLPDNHPDKKQTSQPAGRTPKAPVKKEKKSLSMPEGAGGGGMTGQGILAGLEMYDAFMGPDRIKRRYVRPEDMQSYNPNQYGTGSSAISEYGNTLKPKKAFWGALIGAAGGAGIKPVQGLHNNINEGMAPLLNISNQATARAQQLDTMDFQNTANLQSPQQLLPQQKPYGYMENGGEMRYNNGGNVQTYYEEGKDYDVDEKELQRLLKAGYAVKY